MMDLKNITKVRFNDYTEYDSEKCNNGGCYGFWTDYTRLESGNWEVSYGTTADFEFCPVCGSFGSHEDFETESGYSCGDFEVISEKELLNRIDKFEETEEKYIDFV